MPKTRTEFLPFLPMRMGFSVRCKILTGANLGGCIWCGHTHPFWTTVKVFLKYKHFSSIVLGSRKPVVVRKIISCIWLLTTNHFNYHQKMHHLFKVHITPNAILSVLTVYGENKQMVKKFYMIWVAHLGVILGFFFQYANECDIEGGMIKYTKTVWSSKTSCMNHYCLTQKGNCKFVFSKYWVFWFTSNVKEIKCLLLRYLISILEEKP